MDRDVAATPLGGMAHDLSLWGLFLQADWVVKLVMVGLLLASVWVWAIIFEKIATIRRANRQADAFEHSFWSGGSLDELYRREGERPTHPIAAVFGAAMREWQRSAQRLPGGSAELVGRVHRACERLLRVPRERVGERPEVDEARHRRLEPVPARDHVDDRVARHAPVGGRVVVEAEDAVVGAHEEHGGAEPAAEQLGEPGGDVEVGREVVVLADDDRALRRAP